MASITADPGGRKRILFVAGDGARKAIRIGKANLRQAQLAKLRIEALVASKITGGQLDDETARWLARLPDAMHKRVAAVGLVEPRSGGRSGLAAFIDEYIAGRPGLKPATIIGLKQVRRYLVDHFGQSRDMGTVTADDAEGFRVALGAGQLGKPLAENTIRRTIGRSRQFWKAAIRRGLVRVLNPFEGMIASTRANKARQAFISRETIDKVLAACPDAQWRALVVLARYGGVRMPSEALLLRWSDVLWDQNRVRIPQPKLEHVGKAERIIPLFPELRRALLDVFDEAEPGTEFVITRYRDRAANLRTHFQRIIQRAGVAVWPKLWHNLRASRQTELAETYPMSVCCQWIGNTGAVAMEHYLQTLDSHFARAVAEPAKAAQNPAQYDAESSRTVKDSQPAMMRKPQEIRDNSASCSSVHANIWPLSESNRYVLSDNGF